MDGTAGYFRHTYSGFEPMQAFDIVYGGHFEHRLLGAGNATMEHQRLVLGSVRIEAGSYDFPVIAQGSMPRDGVCIGFVLDGAETTRYNTTGIADDDVQFYPDGVELHRRETTSMPALAKGATFLFGSDTTLLFGANSSEFRIYLMLNDILRD